MLCLVSRSGWLFTSASGPSITRVVLHNFAQQDPFQTRGLKEQRSLEQDININKPLQVENKSLLPSYNLHDTENIISYKTFSIPIENQKSILQFKTNSQLSSEKEADPENSGPDLDKVAYSLSFELGNAFVHQMDWRIYHPNMVFEDRIRGEKYVGLLQYAKFVNLVKFLAHLKFVYVRFEILDITKHKEDNSIGIRWRIAGLGVTRMILRYIPDKLWRRGNINRMAPTWYDGYSEFFVGPDNLIYKHVADRRKPDKDKEPLSANPVVEKLKKLKPTPVAPSPVI